MSFDIIWTIEALDTFQARIEYLKIHWTEKEIKKFKQRVREYLDTLKEEPYIGKPGRIKSVHIGLIIKPVSIIYKIQKSKQRIVLISFIDNRQDPQKVRKYKD